MLAVLLVTIAVIDPLYCADGCTSRDVGLASQSQAKADCPLCQPSTVSRPAAPVPLGAIAIVAPVRCSRVPAPGFHL